MINHWTTRGVLKPDRELLALYLTMDRAPIALHRHINAVQQRLESHPGLDLVRTEWLHCTLLGLASPQDHPAALIDHITDLVTARVAEFPMFQIHVGAPQIAPESVYLPVFDGGVLHAIRNAVERSLRSSGSPVPLVTLPEPPHGFDPHISVAYANQDFPSEELVWRLRGAWPTVPCEVETLQLVDLHCRERQWRWSRALSLPLSTSPSRTDRNSKSTSSLPAGLHE